MKKFIMYVKLADDPNLPEDANSLPLLQIIHEEEIRRTIGLEQITAAVLELSTDLKGHSEYIPWKVEIWSSDEPGCPTVIDRRRRRRVSVTTVSYRQNVTAV